MATRRHNPRRAKSHFSYTIREAADLYGVHPNTVRHWLSEGLKPLDGRKPILIHGTTLNDFHAARRALSKSACRPGEMYCLRCRGPRRPALDMADYKPLTSSLGALVAICSECTGIMTQRVNTARLTLVSAEIEVTVRPAPKPLNESA